VIGLGLRLQYYPGRRKEGFADGSHSQKDETRCSQFPKENRMRGGTAAEVDGGRRRQRLNLGQATPDAIIVQLRDTCIISQLKE
jgi:hypothetical protein